LKAIFTVHSGRFAVRPVNYLAFDDERKRSVTEGKKDINIWAFLDVHAVKADALISAGDSSYKLTPQHPDRGLVVIGVLTRSQQQRVESTLH